MRERWLRLLMSNNKSPSTFHGILVIRLLFLIDSVIKKKKMNHATLRLVSCWLLPSNPRNATHCLVLRTHQSLLILERPVLGLVLRHCRSISPKIRGSLSGCFSLPRCRLTHRPSRVQRVRNRFLCRSSSVMHSSSTTTAALCVRAR